MVIAESVLRLLRQGHQNAITGKELAKRLGESDDRRVRQSIRALIADGVPVASSVRHPYGFYIANNLNEATEYMKVLRSRLVEDAYRWRDFKRATRALLSSGQLNLL